MGVAVLSEDQLKSIISGAIAEGIEEGMQRAKRLFQVIEEPVSLEEAMKLAGYTDRASFRQFCKTNGIQPAEIRAKRNYYLPSQIKKARVKKGIHL